MAMPNRIKRDPPDTSKETKRSHLRLVPRHTGGHSSKRSNHYRVVGTFLGVFFVTLGLIVYLSTNHSIPVSRLYSTFLSLRQGLQDDGVTRFLSEKNALKTMVKKSMTDSSSEMEQNAANNIAVYLFPELLPDEDFEKDVALEQWKPLQEEIEKAPKAPESRILYEEMRANIWNYESPDRENPRISDYAKEVLRLYDELSTP